MRTGLRIGLLVLAVTELALGAWTVLFPRSFYDDVPTVDLSPPYSEHLFRDFGGASLGLGIALAAAWIWFERRLVVVSLLAYLAFSVPHLVFHAGHLDGMSDRVAATLVGVLVVAVLLPAALILVAVRTLRPPLGLQERFVT